VNATPLLFSALKSDVSLSESERFRKKKKIDRETAYFSLKRGVKAKIDIFPLFLSFFPLCYITSPITIMEDLRITGYNALLTPAFLQEELPMVSS
jgi:hypothetical protein